MEAPEAVGKFREFLQAQEELPSKHARAVFSLNEIRRFSRDLASEITMNPLGCIPHIEEELSEISVKHVGFTGALGRHSVTPRALNASLMNTLVSVEGIVTSVSLVRPKLLRSVHYCQAKRCFYSKEYRDATMITRLAPTNTIYPHRDQDGNPLEPEFSLSRYVDCQTVVLQEMPEKSPPGHLPRSCDCIVTEDLVDRAKPGDRIRVYGVYKSVVHNVQAGQFPTQFRTVLVVNNIEYLRQNAFGVEEDSLLIEKAPDQELLNSFEMLASSPLRFISVAPSIFGHDNIKKALALMMVGGNEVVMANGSRIRGDINILLIGDPSTAKSQLLRYVLNFVPLAIATTGRGSTGVGLTAAVVTDRETGERRLEAGAMVLADRGVCCIDEFDKMAEADRVAIHEVMEQQTVTIAKAGIHTTLNARCSVLAAANPILGRYNESASVQDNIRLPESLMTRFDLVFITLDNKTREEDELISQHVLRMRSEDEVVQSVSQNVFRSFIWYARSLRPVMGQEAASVISAEYARLRQKKDDSSLVINVTPRMLDTLVRLSTAHAKLRLSSFVEECDAKEAVEILRSSIERKIGRRGERSRKRIRVAEDEHRGSLAEELLAEDDRAEANRDGGPASTQPIIPSHVLLEKIAEWREAHPGATSCKLSDIPGLDLQSAQEALNELVSRDLVAFEDGELFFFD